MTAPETGPADLDVIAQWAGVGEEDPRRPDLVQTVAGVNAFVASLPSAQLTDPDPEPWPESVVTGATMLAKRFWRRRDTPAGVTQIGDDGAVLNVARSDPDVAMVLGLGAYERPGVR